MKILFSVIPLLLSSLILNGQEAYDLSIQASFNQYKEAIKSVNFNTLVNMAHPKIVERGGGSTYYLESITSEYNMYSKAGMKLKNLEIRQASKVVDAGDDLQAMVPYVRSLEIGEKVIFEKNFFFCYISG